MSFTENAIVKILVIEDDLYMQEILREYLGVRFDVIIMPNGMDALAFLQSGNLPDLIISDLNVPNLSGLELIEQIKMSDFFRSVPIMVLSGEESSEKRVKCLNAGADDFIVKPFNPSELDARINVILRRSGKINLIS